MITTGIPTTAVMRAMSSLLSTVIAGTMLVALVACSGESTPTAEQTSNSSAETAGTVDETGATQSGGTESTGGGSTEGGAGNTDVQPPATDGGGNVEPPATDGGNNVEPSSGDPTIPADRIGNPELITDLVLISGQSNALGVDTTFDASLDVPHPRAYAYTVDGWRIADLHQIWDQRYPLNNPDTDPSNNFGFHFARKVAARRPDRVVGIILVTQPGAAIREWDYESELYVKIRERVTAALNDVPGKATIDGVLWHQGETDWADTEYYATKLNDLIRHFRGESWFGDNKPFICGETVESPLNNRLMALNNDGDNWTGCVPSDDVPTALDGLHFSAEGLRIIGTRYATKYLQMTENNGKDPE